MHADQTKVVCPDCDRRTGKRRVTSRSSYEAGLRCRCTRTVIAVSYFEAEAGLVPVPDQTKTVCTDRDRRVLPNIPV